MWRVIDISQSDRTLSLSQNALKVSARDSTEIARIPIHDIQAVLIHGHGAMLSLNVAAALAEAGAPVVLCAANHAPTAILLPVTGHYAHAERLHAQVSSSKPTHKRLWQQIVQQKVSAQAQALKASTGTDFARLHTLARDVRSGDPDNIEAQAARLYWPRLLGEAFRRDREGDGLNAALNYGYAVLRASMARATVAAGLSPALGLHHRSRLNPFQLVDDLMEPFRPLVDRVVADERRLFESPLEPKGKALLAAIAEQPMRTSDGALPVTRVMDRMCAGLCSVYSGETKRLWCPNEWIALRHGTFDFDG